MKILFSLFLFTILPLVAQDEKREIEVRTLCFSYSGTQRDCLLAGDLAGKSRQEIKLERSLRTKQHLLDCVDDTILVGQPDGDGLKVWDRVTVPKSMSEVLLVFFPLSDPEKPYRVVPVVDSTKDFPLSRFLIANMSPHPLRFKVGEVGMEIQPGKIKLLPVIKEVKANGQVPYYVYFEENGDWSRLSTGFWSILPRKRNFQIAFKNPRTQNVELRGYSDGFPVYKEILKKKEKAKR